MEKQYQEKTLTKNVLVWKLRCTAYKNLDRNTTSKSVLWTNVDDQNIDTLDSLKTQISLCPENNFPDSRFSSKLYSDISQCNKCLAWSKLIPPSALKNKILIPHTKSCTPFSKTVTTSDTWTDLLTWLVWMFFFSLFSVFLFVHPTF